MAVTYEDFMAVLAPASQVTGAPEAPTGAFYIDSGDKDAARIKAALSGDYWHKNVLELVGSLVARGLSDEVILLLAPRFTLPGYTDANTTREIRLMIDGARRKGFAPASSESVPGRALFDHFLDVSLAPPAYVIDGILVENSVAALVAPSYTGKSYIAVDMACSVSAGHPYHGRTISKGGVFCVIGESRSGWRRRVASWCKDKGIEPSRGTMPLHFSRYGLNFRDPATLEAIKAELRACCDIKCCDIKLIIIDTLARSFGGGNENAAQDMGQFIQACDDIMHEFGATVLIVHHTGKDGSAGARGSSAFYAALDTSMEVKKVHNDIQLVCNKQKEGPEFDPLQFCFVELSVAPEPPVLALVQTASANNFRLGKNEQLAMETFKEATNGMSPPCRLHLHKWRDTFRNRHTGDTDKKKDDAFSRARRYLVSKGFLSVEGDYYTLGDKATSCDFSGFAAGQRSAIGDATDTPL